MGWDNQKAGMGHPRERQPWQCGIGDQLSTNYDIDSPGHQKVGIEGNCLNIIKDI